MKDDFTDRLLEESLKHYSRVSAPEGFEERLEARREAGDRRLEVLRWFWLAPAAAALAALVLLVRPAAPPPAPALVGAWRAMPPPPALPVRARPRHTVPLRPHFRVLTAQELARLQLPAELLAPREEKPLTDLEVPEINIPPLRIGEETKEK